MPVQTAVCKYCGRKIIRIEGDTEWRHTRIDPFSKKEYVASVYCKRTRAQPKGERL